MHTAEARVALVVRGVVHQAMRDAGVQTLALHGQHEERAHLVERWCAANFTDDVARKSLVLHAACKTELLLGPVPRADLFPFGDLYATELADFLPELALAPEVARIADQFGGIVALDTALRAFLDERRVPVDPVLAELLDQHRFTRRFTGIVPKLGARTIGIDLFI